MDDPQEWHDGSGTGRYTDQQNQTSAKERHHFDMPLGKDVRRGECGWQLRLAITLSVLKTALTCKYQLSRLSSFLHELPLPALPDQPRSAQLYSF